MKSTYVKEVKGLRCLETKASTIDFEKRTMEAVVSTSMVDRDGEIIRPSAFEKRIDTFRKNPVLLFNHDSFNHPPIGKALELKIGKDAMEAKFQFASKGTHPLADTVFGLFGEGIMNAFSIGFRVFNINHAKDDETGKPQPPEITEAELFEISTVPIPANPEALAKRFQAMDVIRKTATDDGASMSDVSYTYPSDLDVFKRCVFLCGHRMDAKARGEEISGPEEEQMNCLRLSLLDDLLSKPQVTAEAEKALLDLRGLLSQEVTPEAERALLGLRDLFASTERGNENDE